MAELERWLQAVPADADTPSVAVDVAARLARAQTRPSARLAARSTPHLVLAAIVGISTAFRSLLALLHSTPYYLPDEYVYPALARSLATTGRPLVRGGDAHFPALLQPILTAPFQLVDDPEVAYRLTQLFGAAAMSIAAIPVYLLARRVGLAEWYAVACGGLAVATPSMVYAGFMLADPVAYPLALTAVYLAVRALDKPSTRGQVAFLCCAGLATFARTQYVILPIAFALAALALDRWRAFGLHRATAAVVGVAAIGALALGPSRLAGVYSSLATGVDVRSALTWAGRDFVLLAYAAGWVLVPGACVGFMVASRRVQRAFGWFAAFFGAALCAEAGVIAAADAGRFQERYLMALVPLVPVAFGLYLQRGAPHKKVVAAIALALLVFSARVPLSGYAAARGKDDSVFLKAVRQLGDWIGVADAALLVAASAGVLSLVAIALALRPRAAAVAGVALTAVALGSISIGTYGYDRSLADTVGADLLPSDVRWVDHSGVRNAALLMLPHSDRPRSWHQLMWNRSVTDVLLLGRAEHLDGYKSSQVRVARDGRIMAGGRTVEQPLLVQTYGSRAELTGATKLASTADFDLWRPHGTPRMSLLAEGWFMDGWVAWPATVTVWPDESGRVDGSLILRLGLPNGFARTTLKLKARGFVRKIVVSPRTASTLRIHVSHVGPWKLRLSTPHASVVGMRPVTVRGLPPVFERGARDAGASSSRAHSA